MRGARVRHESRDPAPSRSRHQGVVRGTGRICCGATISVDELRRAGLASAAMNKNLAVVLALLVAPVVACGGSGGTATTTTGSAGSTAGSGGSAASAGGSGGATTTGSVGG